MERIDRTGSLSHGPDAGAGADVEDSLGKRCVSWDCLSL